MIIKHKETGKKYEVQEGTIVSARVYEIVDSDKNDLNTNEGRDTPRPKSVSQMNLTELSLKASELGIEIPENATKKEIKELINSAK